MVLLNRGSCRCCTAEGLLEGLQELRATVNTHGRWARPKLLIGIILTSYNYSPEIQSYCSGFNERAITQPTIIITRTIKHDSYSLVKCSHKPRPRILLRTLADRRTQTWAPKQRWVTQWGHKAASGHWKKQYLVKSESVGWTVLGMSSYSSCTTVNCYCTELYFSHISAPIPLWCSLFFLSLSEWLPLCAASLWAGTGSPSSEWPQ